MDADPLAPGTVVEGTVVAHRPYGVELRLDAVEVVGTVEIIYLDDDSTKWGRAGYPPIGERRKAVVLGITPWRRQLRLTMRQAHISGAEPAD